MSVFNRLSFSVLLIIGLITRSMAQEDIRITLPEAEKLFLQQNLSLIGERYNISVARAQVIQARLYNNPTLNFSGNIYNPELNKAFDLSNATGQYAASLQEVIVLAGKRNKQIKLAKTSASMAEHAFFDVLRTLRFTLRSDFYKAYYDLNSIKAYNVQIASLERLDASFNALVNRGVVTLKDAVRIRSLLYSIKAQQSSIRNDFNDVQAELQLLLRNNHATFIPVADSAVAIKPAVSGISLAALTDTAYANRYDLKLTRDSFRYSQQFLSLQKSMVVPDLSLGAEFDRRGSFVENATFFNLGIDLPLFNRNQGNIKAASIAIDQSKARLDLQEQTVENEVQHAYLHVLNAEKLLQTIDPRFRGQFEMLLLSITQNFERRNISLLEFADFYDSYKENILQLNRLQSDKMQAIEELNYSIGKTVINP